MDKTLKDLKAPVGTKVTLISCKMFTADGPMNITYDLYRDLELRPPCTVEDITRAYRKLALKYHPDKATGSTEKFQKIKKAHEILNDPLKKKYYDKFGDKGLRLIAPDGVDSKIIGGTSSFIGKMFIKILIRPTLLVPIFLAIASIGISFVMFLSRIDRKIYGSDFKTTPWYYIFAFLWVVVAFALVLESFYLYAKFTSNESMEKIFEFEEYESIPAPRKRFLKIVHKIKGIVYAFQVFLGTWMFLYCTILLAFNMDDKGNLLNGLTWSKIFFPVVLFFIFFGIIKNILYFLCVLQFNLPNRMWKQRILVISNEFFATMSSIFFFHYLGKWLDSSDKNQMTLFLTFSLIYLRILFYGFRIRCEYNWASEDELIKLTQRNSSNNPHEDIQKKFKEMMKRFTIFIYGFVTVLGLSIGLIHAHIACQWPKTWSATFFPVLFCVYSSIVVFGCCCPCLTFCMELASPPNSFHTFVPAGEEQITIIEISSFYRFGYALAPIQRRITYHCQ